VVIIEVIPFLILAAIAVIAALAMVTSRNAVHAALFLVINFGAIATFYVVLNAPFLAMVQVAVYAGAIMVLFLFVIMLLGAERLGGDSKLRWQRPLAILLSGALLVEGGYLFLNSIESEPAVATALADSNPEEIAELLFDSYLLPFEVTSVLLLVALIGALTLTVRKKERNE
jgi:NADH-quinone oxidoreductase subunit J